MPAYVVVDVFYTDPHWVESYRANVPAMITRFGGRYLALSREPERFEGERDTPETLAIVEFPTMEMARTFLHSEEYRPYAEARRTGARTNILLADGVAG